MTTTTQDTRALIARLQVRLGEGTQDEWCPGYDGPEHYALVEIATFKPDATGREDVCTGIVCSFNVNLPSEQDAELMCLARNELPAQIERWLARLDEADNLFARSGQPMHEADSMKLVGIALGRCAAVTEDVQAWAVRLGVGE